jgi:hypothetical protein
VLIGCGLLVNLVALGALAYFTRRLQASIRETRAKSDATLVLATDIEGYTRQLRNYVRGTIPTDDLVADLNDRLAATGHHVEVTDGRS